MAHKSRRTILECMNTLFAQPRSWIQGSLARFRNQRGDAAYCLLGGLGHCVGFEDKSLMSIGNYDQLIPSRSAQSALRLLAEAILESPKGEQTVRQYFSNPIELSPANQLRLVEYFNDNPHTTKRDIRNVVAAALAKASK